MFDKSFDAISGPPAKEVASVNGQEEFLNGRLVCHGSAVVLGLNEKVLGRQDNTRAKLGHLNANEA